MKRKASALALLAALGGCATADRTGPSSMVSGRPVAGIQGPYGEPIQAVAASRPKTDGVVQASATSTERVDSNVVQAGLPASFAVKKGTSPGLVNPPPGAVAAVGALPGIPTAGGGMAMAGRGARTSVRFVSPAGMQIAWFNPQAGGPGGFTPTMVEVPGRYNFIQGGVYRLKLSNLPGRPMVELYPTLEIMPANPRTCTFLAHSTVPVAFTEEDFEQVAAGNLVVKVVYLPDPAYQDLAVAGPDEVVSTRLEPGVDPIQEAARRGSVLAVIRIGNIDLEAPNTPNLHAPANPGAPFQGMPLQVAPGAIPPGMMPPGGPLSMPLQSDSIPTYPQGTLPPGATPQKTPPPGSAAPDNSPPPPPPPAGTVPPPPPGFGRTPLTTPPTVAVPTTQSKPASTGDLTISAEGMLGRTK
jgi:hypothetical protein